MCQGQVLWKKPGSYPIELCSPLCSLLVSYAAHSVLGLSRLYPFCCGKGIPDQHLKGIITGRTGAGLLNLQCISNSWGARGPSEGEKHVDQMPLCDFLVEVNRDPPFFEGGSIEWWWAKKKPPQQTNKNWQMSGNLVYPCATWLLVLSPTPPHFKNRKEGAIILCWSDAVDTETF